MLHLFLRDVVVDASRRLQDERYAAVLLCVHLSKHFPTTSRKCPGAIVLKAEIPLRDRAGPELCLGAFEATMQTQWAAKERLSASS